MTATDLPASLLSTLPGSYYTDPAIFAAEQEQIFEQMWFCAVRGIDVGTPGAFRTVQVGRESVLVSRNSAGEDVLEQRQNFCPKPHSAERWIVVVRVLPRRQAQFGTRRSGALAAHAEQRATPRIVERRHAVNRSRPGSASQAQQDRLCLIVERVPQQQIGRAHV